MLTPAALRTPRPAMLPRGRTYVLSAAGCSAIPSAGTGLKGSVDRLANRCVKRGPVTPLRLGNAGSSTASLTCSAGCIHG